MVLTDKQTEELNRAVLDYLRKSGFDAAYKAFLSDSGSEREGEKDAGMLEKKWTSVMRLQRKVMELEDKVKSLEEDVKMAQKGPVAQKSKNAARALPRAPHLVELKGHRKSVTKVLLHPVFSVAVSASMDGTIKVWDYEQGNCDSTLRGHVNVVEDIALSANGELLASASTDTTVKLWDFKSGQYKCLRTMQGHEHSVSGVVFAPGGNFLFSCSRDKTIKMWEVSSGFCKLTYYGHEDWVRSVDVNASGTKLVSGSSDKTVRVWDVMNGQCLATFYEHSHVVESVCFAPPSLQIDGSAKDVEFVASGSRDRSIRVFDVNNNNEVLVLEGHDNWVRDVVFHPLGPFLLTCSDDKSVRVWDLEVKRCVRTLANAHDHFVCGLAINPQCTAMLSACVDNTARVWECR